MKNRVVSIIVAIEFLIMIALPLVTFNTKQGVVSESENRKLASFPTIFDQEGKVSETLSQDFDAWFKDNIGLREQMLKLSGIIKYNLFHQSPSKKVEIGKDGWLFYDSESNMDIVRNTYANFEEEQLAIYCDQLIKVQERLEAQGREFVLIIPASKVSVYPEYARSGDYEIQETPADVLADYLEENSDIKVVRLKDTMLEAKANTDELLYYKTDTHWNMKGRYLGYKKIIGDLNEWGMIDSLPLEASFSKEEPYAGDLSGMLGVLDFEGKRYSEKTWEELILINSHATAITSGEYYQTYVDKFGLKKGSMWVNENLPDGKKLLLYGDSMVGRCIVNYLAENFSETTFVWAYKFEQNRIDYLDPDIVMLDISERGLNKYLPGLFDEYLRSNFVLDEKNNSLDVYYYDYGQCDEMWFPVWSVLNEQDDLVWYKADRISADCWHVQVDLTKHESDGNYKIQFYNGPEGKREYVYGKSYYIEKK